MSTAQRPRDSQTQQRDNEPDPSSLGPSCRREEPVQTQSRDSADLKQDDRSLKNGAPTDARQPHTGSLPGHCLDLQLAATRMDGPSLRSNGHIVIPRSSSG